MVYQRRRSGACGKYAGSDVRLKTEWNAAKTYSGVSMAINFFGASPQTIPVCSQKGV
ncbi:hypothetical protein AGR4A_pTi0152 [Agrobacterium tumefaciens str. B6]|uniref:Uncharacterized protein n=1 Tax=Agrobacterium tumefaciens str. B6 TaxID=1183423 RepID=A0A822VEM4_AGRTU|nr:hypothetical protein AGR1C_pTi0156 [Agrobacterium fabacearum TT111]CVI25555.1 hypothetical protein AGR4A_pTi0152 [Agrobacterium tumefaciens str. B6]